MKLKDGGVGPRPIVQNFHLKASCVKQASLSDVQMPKSQSSVASFCILA